MSFFKKNTEITVGLVVVLAIAGWLGWQAYSTSGEVDDLVTSLQDEQETISGLKEKKFTVSKENAKIAEKNLAVAKEKLGALKGVMKTYAIQVPQMGQTEFRDVLNSGVVQLKKDVESKSITVNQKCQDLSFKELLANASPSAEDIKVGLTRLAILKELIGKLPTKQESVVLTTGIDTIESLEWNKNGSIASKTGALAYIPFEMRLTGDQDALREFINGVVASEKLFVIVRAVEFSNPVTFGVKTKDDKNQKSQTGTEKEEAKGKYKEDREIVSNNKVDWKIYMDIIQINDGQNK